MHTVFIMLDNHYLAVYSMLLCDLSPGDQTDGALLPKLSNP